MPPLRSSRVSKACTLCRKQKTRCYPSSNNGETCLRCETLAQTCSLADVNLGSSSRGREKSPTCITSTAEAQTKSKSADERFARLEKTVAYLVERLDSGVPSDATSWNLSEPVSDGSNIADDADPAPVFLIRDAATEVGVRTPAITDTSPPQQSFREITESIDSSTAQSLLKIFQTHYGRWILLSHVATPNALLSNFASSPLLLCSIYLIAVRHTTQELASVLAPKLFQEARTLLAGSLLVTPQTEDFFQAAIVLSLWSTTIGQVPLSIDGWLITSYALQQGSASPVFARIAKQASHQPGFTSNTSREHLWTHLCLAHLHHCVGTRRPTALSQKQIQHLVHSAQQTKLSNFESRMVAEIKLYWLIYQMTSASPASVSRTNRLLSEWREEYASLFEQPRSQFLQLGLHFAHLLADCESLKSSQVSQSTGGRSTLENVLQSSKAIISIFLGTTDDRTRHLTDHVYHVVTFAALTLCRILRDHQLQLLQAVYDLEELYKLIEAIISGLGSVGLPCHAASMLAGVVAARFATLQMDPEDTNAPQSTESNAEPSVPFSETYAGLDDYTFMYPDFSNLDLFGVGADMSGWESWS